MTRRFKQPAGLSGVRGLTAAILYRAVSDAQSSNRDNRLSARQYLGGPLYRCHLDILGLAPDAWPVALESTSVDEFIGITDRLRGKHDGIKPSD